MNLNAIPWWGYVIMAGLSWGTYVPIVFYGGQMLTGDIKTAPLGGRLASILCVGVAYFVLAVLIPLVLMSTRQDSAPAWKPVGIAFASLAGVAGAVGAICVIFASRAAQVQAAEDNVDPATYRAFIAPLIFCLAPLINTVLSLVWHPNAKTGEWAVFHFEMPGWKLLAGIVLVSVGTFLVLMSKEDMEKAKSQAAKAKAATAPMKPIEEAAPAATSGS